MGPSLPLSPAYSKPETRVSGTRSSTAHFGYVIAYYNNCQDSDIA